MKYSSSPTSTYQSFLKHLITGIAIFCILLVSILIYSETAHAGLLSYVNSLFGGEQASAKTTLSGGIVNSQNIALLQAATNYDPNPEKSAGIAPVVANALVADMALAESYSGSDTTSTQISSYIVRDGDTLSGIAKMFGVSVNTIMWANNLSRATALRTGQSLIILPVTGISYTIKSGDTIKGIATRYKADLDEILQYNDLSLNSTLVVGQTILIPDAEVQVSVPTRVASGTNPAHDTNGPSYPGYYTRPLTGGTKTQGLHGYNGIDIGAPVGTSVYASAAGTVIVSSSSGWNGGYGNLIIVSHSNGTQTVYAHLSKNLVSIGQTVAQGDKIGLVGATGKSTGPHLHFEIRGAKNPF